MTISTYVIDDYSKERRDRKKTPWNLAFCWWDNGRDEELTI